MARALLSPEEVEATIQTTIAAVAWLWRRDDKLAIEMRDEFMREWEIPVDAWNAGVDRLVDYALRKGDGPAPHAPFEAVRV